MNVGVLASGAGTNLQALIDRVHGRESVRIAAVVSDKPAASALQRARAAGIDTGVFTRDGFPDRDARDQAIAGWLAERGVELVVLAGYMQLLSLEFLAAFRDRVINVHPSLLPAFPGRNAIGQAIDYGVKVIGVSVFFVDGGIDTGPLILQRAIDLPEAGDPEQGLELLHPIEHELLTEAVMLIARGALSFDPGNPRRVLISR
jgi:phosphoribosylglycinamide formyltransferase 1